MKNRWAANAFVFVARLCGKVVLAKVAVQAEREI